jgi:hypothetical protein
MILLYKGGDKLDIANITLFSVMYKTYATILAKRLLNFVERINAVTSRIQEAERPGTETACSRRSDQKSKENEL